jgi:hypothetical protein
MINQFHNFCISLLKSFQTAPIMLGKLNHNKETQFLKIEGRVLKK